MQEFIIFLIAKEMSYWKKLLSGFQTVEQSNTLTLWRINDDRAENLS